MSWIEQELERRRKEDAARAASQSQEANRNHNVVKGLPWVWSHLVDAMVADIEKFNSLSSRKAEARVSASQVDIHWMGKAAPLLTITLDQERFAMVYTLPSESLQKLKIVFNDYSDPYLWKEGEGRLTFEGASELLLKPVLFP